MPVIIEPDPGAAEALLRLLSPGAHQLDSPAPLDAWLATHPDEHAIVLGPGVDLLEALEISRALRLTRPTTSVILVRKDVDTDLLYQAMQAGCRDVVLAENGDTIRASVTRAHQLWQALHGSTTHASTGTKPGSVITIYAPKGGVGKTTTSVNVALALAQGGARRVCIVDLDLAFGDVAITLGLVPAHNIEEAIGAEDSLDESLVRTLLIRYENQIDVLAAPNLPDARDRITPVLVSRMLRNLRNHFDYVVVDTAPNFDDQTLQALDETDECVIIATLDVPTLKNVKVALETLDLLNIAPGHRHLVLNRADEEVGLDHDKVQQILHMPIAAPIPSATEIAAATNAGKPILLANPGHAASKAFRQLAHELAAACGDDLAGDSPDDHERRGMLRRKRK